MIRRSAHGWAGRSARALVAVLGTWVAGELAVAGLPAVGTTPLELTVVGGPALNPNAQGRASPVVVRIFDLASARTFESADFETLFEHADRALKQDLVAQEEFVLRPGEIQQRDRTLAPQVQALGVAAAFRDVGHAVWHLIVPVIRGRRNFLLIDLDQNTIRLMPVDPG